MSNINRFNLSEQVEGWLKDLKGAFSLVDPKISEWNKQYESGHIEHYKSVMDNVQCIIGGHPEKTIQVLDVGAVPGHVAALLKYAGLSVHAVDINPQRVEGLFNFLEIPYHEVNVEIEPLPFPDDSFSLVLFCEILEHLRTDPLKPLHEIFRIIMPGGNLLLSTPNITPLMRWRFLFGEDYQADLASEFAKLNTIGHIGHFRLYSLEEVRKLLFHVGFRIIKVDLGGKLKIPDKRWDARILHKIMPRKLHSQLYVLARK